MALTTWVVYRDADGLLVRASNDDSGNTPSTGAGQSALDVGLMEPVPTKKTHKVVGGALVVRDSNEVENEDNAEKRERLRRLIANHEAMKDKYQTEAPPWDTTELDADIARFRAEHNAIP